MKHFLLFLILLSALNINALDYKIESRAFYIEAEISENLNQINFNWDYDSSAFYYIIRKKNANEKNFQIIDSIPGDKNFWIDSSPILDSITEYSFIKNYYYISPVNSLIDTLNSYSYPIIGKNIPPKHFRGSILLLIDESHKFDLNFEISRLKNDLIAEGWKVYVEFAPRSENFSPENIKKTKQLIINSKTLDSTLNTVFLIGRIAVPYSGVTAPDGHADHMGAWPADIYYADLDGIWTDTSMVNSQASDSRNHNLIDDGKFDQFRIPSDTELAIGRVDFYNLPLFQESELKLLKRYFDKNHEYRNGLFNVIDSAIVDDRFGAGYIEAFAAGGLMNFHTLLGNKINTYDYLRFAVKDANRSFKWIYGCGPGSFTSAHDIAYSEEFAGENHNAIFAMIFGSYHGDWDSENNLLRSAIASKPSILSAIWSGRPTWILSHMLFDETMGYSARLSQNYSFSDYPNMSIWGTRVIHIALIGDPTLRNEAIPAMNNISIEQVAPFEIEISWQYDYSNNGFFVYKFDEFSGNFTLLNEIPVFENSFLDKFPKEGKNIYLVRANKLIEHHYGSHFILSNGMKGEIEFAYPEYVNKFLIYPNPAKESTTLFIQNPNENFILIYDITGRVVRNIPINNKKYHILDIEDLSAGTYFLKIGNTTEIFIKI